MKITSFTTIYSRIQTPTRQQNTNFEALLQDKMPHNRQGDEYYWHHQQQLQRSALTFDAHDNQITPTYIGLKAQEAADIASIKQSFNNTQDIAQTNRSPISYTMKSAELTPGHLRIDKTTHQINLQHPYIFDAHPLSYANTSNKPVDKAPTPLMRFTTIRSKPYQLFIKDKTVELTLNTNAWSDKHRDTLKKTITTWLKQQGYSLQQLIINGVIQ
jgi:hypothetical protein